MAPPTRWRRKCCGNWAPTSSPSGVTPDGTNINLDCGSTAPQAMCAKVREVRADFGIALDGDADRVVMADEKGRIIDGDQILALIAKSWSKSERAQGRRRGRHRDVECRAGSLSWRSLNLKLARAAVGDRYVLEEMHKGGFNVGGEQSGHIILSRCLHHRRRPGGGAAGAGGAGRRKASPPARRRICSIRCRRCWRMCASRRARRWTMRG